MTPAQKITKARAGLIMDHPFFGTLAFRLRVVDDPATLAAHGIQTAATDGDRLVFNPDWIEGLSLAEVKGVVAHEVLHCALAHMSRRQDRQAKKWNVAADMAINPTVQAAGLTLPQGVFFPPSHLAGQSAEAIYNSLPDSPGGGAGGDPGGCGAVLDAPGQNGQAAGLGQLDKMAAEWKVATAQAAQAAKAAGKLPAELARLVEELLAPKLDWVDLLRRFVERSFSRDDYSWMRANRRYIAQGLYLPSLHSESIGHVAVAIDTSGSIGQAELDQFAAELSAILEDAGAGLVTVIYCDAQVAGVQAFARDDLPLALDAKGGGRTDFRPPFAWLDEQGAEPICLVYLTDGCCNSFPDIEPPYQVLWTISPGGLKGFRPPWGEVVAM